MQHVLLSKTGTCWCHQILGCIVLLTSPQMTLSRRVERGAVTVNTGRYTHAHGEQQIYTCNTQHKDLIVKLIILLFPLKKFLSTAASCSRFLANSTPHTTQIGVLFFQVVQLFLFPTINVSACILSVHGRHDYSSAAVR